jgi:hypothetical protein
MKMDDNEGDEMAWREIRNEGKGRDEKRRER